MVYQPTLWDNLEFNKGLLLMEKLNLSDAVLAFNRSLENPLTDTVLAGGLIKTCKYWQHRVEGLPITSDPTKEIRRFINDYSNYTFTAHEKNLRCNLLKYFAAFVPESGIEEPIIIENIFDLIMDIRLFQAAEDFARQMAEMYPDDITLQYLYAEALWETGKRAKANNLYTVLLVSFPESVKIIRIKNEPLVRLVKEYGAAMAASYAVSKGILEIVALPEDISVGGPAHQKALRCYLLLKEMQTNTENQNQKGVLQGRKELQKISPKLFQEYFRRLHHNDSRR